MTDELKRLPIPAQNITPGMLRGISQYRRAMLEQETKNGLFRDGNSLPIQETDNKNYLGNVQRTFKQASTSSSSSGNPDWRGGSNPLFMPGELYSPLWNYSNLSLPRDRATINAWCRSFYALNAYVHNAINLHSTYPISKLNIKCKNKKVENFFAALNEELDLMNVCVQIAQEYWTLGEAFPYAEYDKDTLKWKKIILQNPDYVVVKHSVVAGEPIIALRPDENLKRICTSNNAVDKQQRQNISSFIIDHVKKGENIPLSNFNVSHIANKISPYETRGTGLPVPAFKPLMLFDMYRESKYVQASNFVNPWTLIKVGSPDHKPTPQDIQIWRDTFQAAEADRNFRIITHQDVTIEKVGNSGGVLDISNDVTALIKEIYIALMVPSALMDGGADTTYANAGVALDVLRQRYMTFRNILSNWLRRKIFAPLCEVNDFYERIDGEKVLIVPEVDWNHMSLFDAGDYVQQLMTLNAAQPRQISKQTIYRSLGLDYKDEMRKIREETVDEVILEKEKGSLEKMSLNELKSIGPNDEIREIPDQPVPGEESETAPPEEEAGLPGMPPPGPSPIPTPPRPV